MMFKTVKIDDDDENLKVKHLLLESVRKVMKSKNLAKEIEANQERLHDLIDEVFTDLRNYTAVRMQCVNSVFHNSDFNKELLNLPFLILLDRWKRQRTKSQNMKLEKFHAYIPHSTVQSHNIQVRKDIQDEDLSNIDKIIMRKVDKRPPKRFDTLMERSKLVTGRLAYHGTSRQYQNSS